jgi:hypothetical protein
MNCCVDRVQNVYSGITFSMTAPVIYQVLFFQDDMSRLGKSTRIGILRNPYGLSPDPRQSIISCHLKEEIFKNLCLICNLLKLPLFLHFKRLNYSAQVNLLHIREELTPQFQVGLQKGRRHPRTRKTPTVLEEDWYRSDRCLINYILS